MSAGTEVVWSMSGTCTRFTLVVAQLPLMYSIYVHQVSTIKNLLVNIHSVMPLHDRLFVPQDIELNDKNENILLGCTVQAIGFFSKSGLAVIISLGLLLPSHVCDKIGHDRRRRRVERNSNNSLTMKAKL